MNRSFRYLRARPIGVRTYRRSSRTRSLLLVGLAFVLGITIGFNIRDIMIRTCRGLPSGEAYDATGCLNERRLAFMEPTKRPPPVFTKLPDRFLANVTRHKIANTFPLRPQSYLDKLKSNSTRYFMTFLIKSTSFMIERRFLIRQTWGAIKSINGYSFGIVFVIGNMTTPEEQKIVQEENDLYGDILQSDVPDNYFSLPLKVLSSMQWIVREIGNISDYFVTTDDDCYVNMPIAFEYFANSTSEKHSNIYCGFMYNKVSRPIRKHSKYEISVDIYPEDAYPTFCHGGMTVMSFQSMSDIYRTAEITDFGGFHLEDVLITGILRQKTYNHSLNVKPINYHGLAFYGDPREKIVSHFGTTRKLHVAFAVRWRRTRRGLGLLNDNGEPEKDPGAQPLNVTITAPPSLPGMPLNRTMTHFVTRWRALKPRSRYTSQIRPHLPVFRSKALPPEDAIKQPQTGDKENADDDAGSHQILVEVVRQDGS